jgi:hypothetical protein
MHQEIHNFKKKRVNYKEFIYSIGCAIKDLWGFYANSWSIVELQHCYQLFLIPKGITGNGQLISKGLFDFIVSTKKPTKFL